MKRFRLAVILGIFDRISLQYHIEFIAYVIQKIQFEAKQIVKFTIYMMI